MTEGFYKAVTKELRKLGFVRLDGGKGSHEKWRGGVNALTLTVPRNLMSRHTANAILKDAGSSLRF